MITAADRAAVALLGGEPAARKRTRGKIVIEVTP